MGNICLKLFSSKFDRYPYLNLTRMTQPLIIGKNGQLSKSFRQVTDMNCTCLSSEDLDLRKTNFIKQILKEYNPSLILNFSSFNNVDLAESSYDSFLINSIAIKEISEFCFDSDIPLIHISTDFVFDGTSGNYSEQSVTNPVNRYGESKYLGEKYIQEILSHYMIIRTSWLYSSQKDTGNFFNKILNSYLSEGAEFMGAYDSIGSPTSATTLSEFLVSVIPMFLSDKDVSGLYHFANLGEVSRFSFIETILLELNRKFSLGLPNVKKVSNNDFNLAASRPLNTSLDCRKIIDVFNYELLDWKRGLRVEVNKI